MEKTRKIYLEVEMKVLSYESLDEVVGGANKWFILGGLSAFFAGLVAGLFNPLACNNK